MSLCKTLIQAKAEKGEEISNAIWEALQLAARERVPVALSFNGSIITLDLESVYKDAHRLYWESVNGRGASEPA